MTALLILMLTVPLAQAGRIGRVPIRAKTTPLSVRVPRVRLPRLSPLHSSLITPLLTSPRTPGIHPVSKTLINAPSPAAVSLPLPVIPLRYSAIHTPGTSPKILLASRRSREIDRLLDSARDPDSHAEEASAALAQAFDGYLADLPEFSPEESTYLGLHAGDGRLTSYDKKSVQRRRGFYRRTLRALKRIDTDELPAQEQFDHRLLTASLEDTIDELTRDEDYDIEDFLSAPLETISLHFYKEFAPERERALTALSRLEQFPKILRQGYDRIDNPPRISVDHALEGMEGARTFVSDASKRLVLILPEEKDRIEKAALAARRELIRFEKFLLEIQPKANGAWAYGKKAFKEALANHYIDRSIRSLRKQALKEMPKTLAEMRGLAEELFPGDTWKQAVDALGKDHGRRDEVLDVYRRTVAETTAHINEHGLATLPQDHPLVTVETPDFLNVIIPEAAYDGPLLMDKSRKGHMFITLPPGEDGDPSVEEWLQANAHTSFIRVTTVHEGMPGHHLQLTNQKLLKSRLRRTFWDVYTGEGWAHYAESLMDETGFFTKEDRLMLLFERYWQLVRARVTIGMHAEGWSMKRAAAYFKDKLGVSSETAYYSARYNARLSPVESMAYALGRLEILRIREETKQRLGERFTLKEFHDRLLSYGAIPLLLIEKLLERDWR